MPGLIPNSKLPLAMRPAGGGSLMATILKSSRQGPAQPGFMLTSLNSVLVLGALNSTVLVCQPRLLVVPAVIIVNRLLTLPTTSSNSVLDGGASGLTAILKVRR